MRITFISPVVSMGGGTKVVAIYANALMKMGHEVTIISTPNSKPGIKYIIKHLLKERCFPKKKSSHSHIDEFNIKHHVIDKPRPIVDADVPDADVVIATWWETAEWVMGLSCKKGTKVYFIQHHEVHPYLPIERCKATYHFPMHKIVIANWLKNIMETEYDGKNCDLVPNSVEHKQFNAAVRNKQPIPTVGFLYNKSSYKGVNITIAAIKILKQCFPDLRVISFGAADPKNDPLFEEYFEFHYSPEQNYIKDIYSQCDAWITASITEGFNLPAMEAMACRTPVASTKAGWPEEAVLNGYNGVLVDVNDTKALADGVIEILNLSNGDWKKMSENAYKTVEGSSWANSAKMFENALKNACLRAKKQ